MEQDTLVREAFLLLLSRDKKYIDSQQWKRRKVSGHSSNMEETKSEIESDSEIYSEETKSEASEAKSESESESEIISETETESESESEDDAFYENYQSIISKLTYGNRARIEGMYWLYFLLHNIERNWGHDARDSDSFLYEEILDTFSNLVKSYCIDLQRPDSCEFRKLKIKIWLHPDYKDDFAVDLCDALSWVSKTEEDYQRRTQPVS
jgi:hypothetical protein